ncbi:hypothetical protein RyT2_19280 [Pseudolactococcus yaeyamensis]
MTSEKQEQIMSALLTFALEDFGSEEPKLDPQFKDVTRKEVEKSFKKMATEGLNQELDDDDFHQVAFEIIKKMPDWRFDIFKKEIINIYG